MFYIKKNQVYTNPILVYNKDKNERLFKTRYSICSPKDDQINFVKYYVCPDTKF